MKLKIIIAREGLIILGFIIIFFVASFIDSSTLFGLSLAGYPVYLLFRFVIWALKTLQIVQVDNLLNQLKNKILIKKICLWTGVSIFMIVVVSLFLNKDMSSIPIMPLTQEQFRSLRDKGYSTEKIVELEKKRTSQEKDNLESLPDEELIRLAEYIEAIKQAGGGDNDVLNYLKENNIQFSEDQEKLKEDNKRAEEARQFEVASQIAQDNRKELARRELARRELEGRQQKVKEKWRLLRKGMNQEEVRQILGEPTKIDSNAFWMTWSYPGGGEVKIDYSLGGVQEAGVSGWTEPF